MCRSGKDECDLPEYCNGSSSFCQSDVFAQVRLKPRLLVDSSGEGLTGVCVSERAAVPEPAGLLLQREVPAPRRPVSRLIRNQ